MPRRPSSMALCFAAVVGVVAASSARGDDPVDAAAPAPASADAEASCPAPMPGTLTVDTSPWTIVSVDGVLVGTTPLFRAELPAGPHTLTFENEARGIAVLEDIVIEEGRHHKLKLLLAPDDKETLLAARQDDAGDVTCISDDEAGFLSLQTTPWSRVWVDGRLVGVTPLFQQKVRAGIHAVRFMGPAGQLLSARIQVGAGEVVKVSLPLPGPADDGLRPR